MADEIVYPWHGSPHRYIDTGDYYALKVTTEFDPNGQLIMNRFGLPERLSDDGDGNQSVVFSLTKSASDRRVTENGLEQRYTVQADGTHNLVVAEESLGGTDVEVWNRFGLAEMYVDLLDGTYARLIGGATADTGVLGPLGLPLGFDESGGAYSPMVSGESVEGSVESLIYNAEAYIYNAEELTYGID